MSPPLTSSTDAAIAHSAVSSGTRHPAWILVATVCASSLALIDGSVVNLALPSIGRDLAASSATLQWTVNAYLLPLSALLLLGGAAGDHFGRRRLLIAGILMFAGASMLCALAPNSAVLLAGRALQGVGSALLMPNSLAILGSAFAGEARGRAIGTWAAAGAIAGALGPPLGGWLVVAGWRAIFLINAPVAAIAIFAAARYVEESGKEGAPLDWWGASLATAALAAITWALTVWSNHAASAPLTVTVLLVGMLLLAAFLVVERRRGEDAMVPLSLFASSPFVGLTVLTFLLYGALSGFFVLLPYLLITGGYSPVEAGLAVLPIPITIGFGSRLVGPMSQKSGPRWWLTVGPITAAAGLALLVLVDPQRSYWTSVLPGVAAFSVGLAMAVAPLTVAVLASVDADHIGTASGFNSATARTGGLIATALGGAVISRSGSDQLDSFHAAAIIGAVLALLAGASAFLTLGATSPRRGIDTRV